MGTQRTSNKDILEAIASQTAAINALVGAITGQAQAQAETPVTEATEPQSAEIPKYDPAYMAHMKAKVSGLVANDGQARVLYARRNGHGEAKLAYCLKSNWKGLRDNGKLGAIEVFTA